MKITKLFQALGNDVRWRVMNLLLEEKRRDTSGLGLCVCNIVKKCRVANSTMSHHLDCLRSAGFLTAKKRGKWIYYDVNMKTLVSLKETLSALG
ncbi:MAG: winged helix-turn-helix transcriptional regulator [Deltaproteobacteria bacterium]|nr:winged helix-turn-helix transcriptional regulator [Candidatus Omnitrophota bacterium]MBI2343725.1 winged helix-turn-helix transcriptional regulator [Deltaproteobacteria bacterium]